MSLRRRYWPAQRLQEDGDPLISIPSDACTLFCIHRILSQPRGEAHILRQTEEGCQLAKSFLYDRAPQMWPELLGQCLHPLWVAAQTEENIPGILGLDAFAECNRLHNQKGHQSCYPHLHRVTATFRQIPLQCDSVTQLESQIDATGLPCSNTLDALCAMARTSASILTCQQIYLNGNLPPGDLYHTW